MKHNSFSRHFQITGLFISGVLALTCGLISPTEAAEPVNPLLKEFTIKIDPSALKPPTHWHVPGMTPLIWTMDPVNMEAYKTTDVKELQLKPGNYRFGTFTFDFLFKVTLSGVLEFAETLDQCVEGRGTQVLTIRCSHTQPYPQDPDYYK
ncbi:MAG: hypothetical protein AB7T38_16245 [Nitrospirales bacterium]